MGKKLLSVVVACYNEEEALPYFYKEIVGIAKKMKEKKKVNLPRIIWVAGIFIILILILILVVEYKVKWEM